MHSWGPEERMTLTLRLRIRRFMIIKCVQSVNNDVFCLSDVFEISGGLVVRPDFERKVLARMRPVNPDRAWQIPRDHASTSRISNLYSRLSETLHQLEEINFGLCFESKKTGWGTGRNCEAPVVPCTFLELPSLGTFYWPVSPWDSTRRSFYPVPSRYLSGSTTRPGRKWSVTWDLVRRSHLRTDAEDDDSGRWRSLLRYLAMTKT